MIDTDKYEGHTPAPWESKEWDEGFILGPTSERDKNSHPVVAVVGDGWWGDMMPECNANLRLMTDAPLLLAEVKRLREVVKVLSKYRDIVIKFDDALLADGDTDIRWSAIYDERVFE